ncbi:MAG: hypothetical protein IT360_04375 [Gemmatimonadaceae bacterium]|nr:hypothetical protein [Gemmatimonadaceae bacterium]
MRLDSDSLAGLFGLRPPEGSEQRLDAGAIEAIGKAVLASAGAALGPGAPAAITQAVACVADAFETRLSEIAVSAWNKRTEISKYADLQKYPAGQKRYVQLYEHPVKWRYRPYLEVSVKGVTFTIDIVIDVKLTIDQAVLVIDGGRVMAIEPGKVKAEATAKIGAFSLCDPIKKELGELPGSISFGAGIPIEGKEAPAPR